MQIFGFEIKRKDSSEKMASVHQSAASRFQFN